MSRRYKTTAERVLAGKVSPEAVERVLDEERQARVSPTVPKGEEPSEENVYTATEVRRLLVAAWHQTHSSPLNAESLADSLLRCATPRRAAPPSAPPEPIDEVVAEGVMAIWDDERRRLKHGNTFLYDEDRTCFESRLRIFLTDHARLRGDRR